MRSVQKQFLWFGQGQVMVYPFYLVLRVVVDVDDGGFVIGAYFFDQGENELIQSRTSGMSTLLL